MKFRIGLGYDVHALKDGLEFFLGGIKLRHSKGCIAHSDGDVLIHAICDALLGAANMRDIGFHFPDNDKSYENIDSKILLKKTNRLLIKNGYKIANIDSVICLQSPKIEDHIEEMKTILANILEIDRNDLSIKATTTEKLGFEGREEGVSAQSVALIYKIT